MQDGAASGRSKAVATSLALLVGSADDALVVFRPGVTSAQTFNAIGRINGKAVWADRAGAVWAIKLDAPGNDIRALYRSGALLVSHSSAIALGCLS